MSCSGAVTLQALKPQMTGQQVTAVFLRIQNSEAALQAVMLQTAETPQAVTLRRAETLQAVRLRMRDSETWAEVRRMLSSGQAAGFRRMQNPQQLLLQMQILQDHPAPPSARLQRPVRRVQFPKMLSGFLLLMHLRRNQVYGVFRRKAWGCFLMHL